MSKASNVNWYLLLKERAAAVGLTLVIDQDCFAINDAPKANGRIALKSLKQAEKFIRGYELGYAANL